MKHHLLNNGDDCCIIVERGDALIVTRELPGFFANLGFLIDIEGQSATLEGISFCQTSPVYDGNRWVMVRNPRTAVSKDVTILKNWSEKEYRCYLTQLGLCGSAVYGNMPVWSSFYRCLSRAGDGWTFSKGLVDHVSGAILDTGLGRLANGVEVSGPITWQSRASFGAAFGMAPDIQRHWEAYFDAMAPGGREFTDRPAVSLHL